MELAHYRLKFKRPFGIAHGVRDGTDALFLRVTLDDHVGLGEVTFPPYLPWTASEVEREVCRWAPRLHQVHGTVNAEMLVDLLDDQPLTPPCRNVLFMALSDLLSRRTKSPTWKWLKAPQPDLRQPMITLGHCTLPELPQRLAEMPRFPILKVKLGTETDEALLPTLMRLDDRPLFIDGNQGIKDIDMMYRLIDIAGDRLVGIEQPFSKDRNALHAQLANATDIPVYGDESIQGMDDLERGRQYFTGVNIKLLKCGGLDRAVRMAERARAFGMNVMLGSMSESSLGCTAMAHLGGLADVVDVDGPWLLSNDPCKGLEWSGRHLEMPVGLGHGVDLVSSLEFNPIGA